MNYMKRISFMTGIAMSMLLISSPLFLSAQTEGLPDTVRYDLENHVQLLLSLENAAEIESITNLTALSRQLYTDLEQLGVEVIRSATPLRVRYRYLPGQANKLIIDRSPASRQAYTFDPSTGEPQLNKVAPDTVFLVNDPTRQVLLVADYLEDLQQLQEIDLDALLQETIAKAKAAPAGQSIYSRLAVNRKYTVEAGRITAAKDGYRPIAYDQLVLQGHAGLGIIRDKWIPEWSIDLGVNLFNKRKVPTINAGVSATAHFVFDRLADRSYDMAVNTFVDLYGRVNLSPKGGDPLWLGMSVGYLVRRNGDFFDKNTFRAALQFGNNTQRIQVVPEFYFSDNFKTAYPGIRFKFGF